MDKTDKDREMRNSGISEGDGPHGDSDSEAGTRRSRETEFRDLRESKAGALECTSSRRR